MLWIKVLKYGGHFKIKMTPYLHMNSYSRDNMFSWPSYFYNSGYLHPERSSLLLKLGSEVHDGMTFCLPGGAREKTYGCRAVTDIMQRTLWVTWSMTGAGLLKHIKTSDLGMTLVFINSLRPSDAYIRHWTGSSMVQIMACRLFGAKPLSEPMLEYY